MNQSTINRKIREIRRLLDELAAEVENTPDEPKAPQTKPLARMRTIPEAVREIKEADPQSHLSVSAMRRWVKEGKIPTVSTSKTALVNMADVERFLRGGA